MFGYIRVNKMDLTFREFDTYKGYYCGLCKFLKRNHSEISRLSINYDITFLILLISSVYGFDTKIYEESCIANPFKRKKHLENEVTEYAASMNILLAYYKFEDNVADDGGLLNKMSCIVFKNSFKSAYKKYPQKAEFIKKCLRELSKIEKEDIRDVDRASNTFGNLMREIFSYRDDDKKDILGNIGFGAGKYVYIMDAYEDLYKDIQNGSYNPFKPKEFQNKPENIPSGFKVYNQEINRRMDMNIGFSLAQIEEGIRKLNPELNRGIIDNIIYSGIYLRYKNLIMLKTSSEKTDKEI